MRRRAPSRSVAASLSAPQVADVVACPSPGDDGTSLATHHSRGAIMRVKLRRPESRRRPRTKVNWPVVVELDDRGLHGETIDVSQLGVKGGLGGRLGGG